MKKRDEESAFSAICNAQRIACAPFEFEAARSLRDFGILAALDKAGDPGLTDEEIKAVSGLSDYAVRVLLNAAEGAGILKTESGRTSLTKTGWFLLNDPMTKANFDFAADVCIPGVARLSDSLREGRPTGLSTLGPWDGTLYPHLRELSQPARESWFGYDQFFSDNAFSDTVSRVTALHPTLLCDIGGNTGKWAIRLAKADPSIRIRIVDLPEQCETAAANIAAAGLSSRVACFPDDVMSGTNLPGDPDIWWMSQFLDRFGEADVVRILKKVRNAMRPGSRILILEPLIGNQKFPIGDRCLAAFSLYFTAIANGCSRFYSEADFRRFALDAGLEVESVENGLGIGHTLITLTRGDKS